MLVAIVKSIPNARRCAEMKKHRIDSVLIAPGETPRLKSERGGKIRKLGILVDFM